MTGSADRSAVAAVLVVWKQLGPTLDAIESLRQSTVSVHPIVCVAQELPREDAELLKVALGEGLVIELEDNIGFSSALNLGMTVALESEAEWALLLNNDAVIDPQCVELCLREAEGDERIGVVSPAIRYSERPERLWFAGASASRWWTIVWHRGHFASTDHLPPSSDCDYIPSCCALMSLDAWRNVGPMRDDYFMYFEDVEWGERARISGWRLRYLAEVLCAHVMAGSSVDPGSRYLGESSAYYLARNPVRFARETTDPVLRATRTFGAVVLWSLYNLTRVRRSDWSTVAAALKSGISDGWVGRMGRRDLASRQVPSMTKDHG